MSSTMASCVWRSARICPRFWLDGCPSRYDTGEVTLGVRMGNFETLDVGGESARLYVVGDFAPGAPGVVVLHAWWGLNDDVVAYADQLAASGFAGVVPDMFGR